MLIFSFGALYNGKTITGEFQKLVNNVNYKSFLVINLLLITSFIFILYDNFLSKKGDFWLISKTNIPFILFFIFATLSYFWADDKALFFNKFKIITSAILTYYLAKNIKITSNNLFLVSLIFAVTVFSISSIGIFQWFIDFKGSDFLAGQTPVPSTFGNKNIATHVIVISLPLVLYYFLRSKHILNFSFSVLSFFSALIFIYLSATKGAILAIFVELIVLLLFILFSKVKFSRTFSKSEYLALFLIIIFSFILFFDSFFGQSFDNLQGSFKSIIESSDARITSLSVRIYIWADSLSYFLNSPLYGHGLGNFNNELSYDGYFHVLQRAHNDILELAVELGIIGLVLFLSYLILILRDQLKIINSSKDSLFFSLIFISFLGIFSHAQVSFPFQLGVVPIIFAFLVSIHTQKASEYKKEIKITIPRVFKHMTFVFLSILFLFLGKINLQHFVLPSIFFTNSGTHFSKYNKKALEDLSDFPFQDSRFYDAYMAYYNEDYKERALEIMDIALGKNPKNMYALRKQFEYHLERKNFERASKKLKLMEKVGKYHAFTFLSAMEFYKYTNNKDKALNFFDEVYKNYLKTDPYDKGLTKYLLFWSITLERYDSTEFLYNKIIQFYGSKFEIDTLSNMANFYAYIGDLKKGYSFYKSVNELTRGPVPDKFKSNQIKPNVLEAYKKYESKFIR